MYLELKVEPSDNLAKLTNKAVLIAQTLCLDVKFTFKGEEVHILSRESVRDAHRKVQKKYSI
jgi:hypothetical protein